MKPRSDSYEATLSDEQREELHALLSQPELSLAQVRLLAPPWGSGRRDGAKPSIGVLSMIGARLRQERMLVEVEATAKLMEAVRNKAKSHAAQMASGEQLEQIIDVACDLVGQEVVQKTLTAQDPKNRTAALRTLLKRVDQKHVDRRIKLLEEKAAKADTAKGILQDKGLSEDEKAAKMRSLFGVG